MTTTNTVNMSEESGPPSLRVSVLLVEDDVRLSEMLKEYLSEHGIHVTIARNGMDGLKLHLQHTFDAVILDLMLPDVDGLEVCRRMRDRGNVPVIMLTAKGESFDRVIGLELGADDYMPKPFEPRELLARVRAILRRSRYECPDAVIRFGRLEIDREALEARVNGERCDLTPYQFQILDLLSRAAGRVLSRDLILSQIQGDNDYAFDRSIDVHVSRIRSLIEDDPRHPRRIITVRGAGYMFVKGQD